MKLHKPQARVFARDWPAALGLVLASAVVLACGGCTHWATHAVHGQRQQVGQRPLGAPQIAQTTTASASAGFGATSRSRGDRRTIAGGLAGTHDSLTRTHCIQKVEIEYVQPVHTVATVKGRGWDVAGSVVLGVIGLSGILSAHGQSDSQFDDESSSAGTYAVGGLMLAGGVGWLVYSYVGLPRGPSPASEPQELRWTETEFVDATGCGLVPADVATGSGEEPVDSEARLRELERLRASGLLTEDEYQRKRRDLVDSL